MRFAPRRRHVLPLAALIVAAPFVPHAWTSSAGSQAIADDPSEVIGPDGATVVERHVSSDMVVDWLEAPPGGADEWRDGPEAPAGHGVHDHGAHDHGAHDHGAHEHDERAATDEPYSDRADAGTVSFTEAAAASGTSGPTPGQGFAVFSASSRWLRTGYTVRLTGADARIEQYRDEFAAAARAASSAAGLPVRVAAGRKGSSNPSRGEITVVLAEGPCGSKAVGCGGPALSSTELVSGRVWIYPSALNMSAANRLNLANHELGHALGLQHYGSNWSDGRQTMYPVISGLSSYRAGDGAGLRFMAGAFDRPAGTVTERTYAAGALHVSGTVTSGSRVRVTVGRTSEDVTASGGRFTASIAAAAGSHRVCVASLDAAPGFRRALGCAGVSAPGAPLGGLDAVANSFETIRVEGWAIDPQTAAAVEVEIRRNGAVVRKAKADEDRPDVAKAHARYGAAHGFRVEVPAVAGTNDVCVRILGVGAGGNKDLGCRKVTHAVDPVGAFEVAASADLGGTVSGWALDPNTPSPVNVTVTVDGAVPAVPGIFRAADHRPDVARKYPAHGPAHGFSQRLVLTAGDHEVCLTVANVGLGQDRSLGCTRIRVDDPAAPGTVVDAVRSATTAIPLPAVPAVDGVVDDAIGTVTTIADGLVR